MWEAAPAAEWVCSYGEHSRAGARSHLGAASTFLWGFSPMGGCPCGRMCFSPVGGCPCGRMGVVAMASIREQGLAPTWGQHLHSCGAFSPVGGCPCGRMCFSPVGGCPCGRMGVVAMASIREQGLAPTWKQPLLSLSEHSRAGARSHLGAAFAELEQAFASGGSLPRRYVEVRASPTSPTSFQPHHPPEHFGAPLAKVV